MNKDRRCLSAFKMETRQWTQQSLKILYAAAQMQQLYIEQVGWLSQSLNTEHE